MTNYKKIYNSLILVIFTLHHFSFLFVFIVSNLKDNGYYINDREIENIMYYCKVASVITILTVVCGGLIEILDCLL